MKRKEISMQDYFQNKRQKFVMGIHALDNKQQDTREIKDRNSQTRGDKRGQTHTLRQFIKPMP